ncbi:SEC-C domain-containing protein [Kribbella antibiotica]|uniref:SEC-C domain-containing protein n=1 Tax=Kribbella antibiotica TaxID=190195 RepID=A0A4R4ZN10_9ACTN|nr:SEC-C domain-containing protein [Kribbella antibiotica]TDD59324.1 SEC-C domain-containing protein [Kribbella antibiotica]
MDDLQTDDDFDCYDEDEELRTFQRMLALEPALDRWRPSVRHEERGDHMGALISYTRALDGLSPEEICSFWGSVLVSGRRRARWALGIALDSTDRLAVAGAVERVDRYFDVLDALRAPKVEEGQVEVWSRSELLLALERWPQRITSDSIADYYREVERALRTCGGGGVAVVQRTLECTDGGATTVAWPPARNQGCWCDSGVRYKRCCGGEVLAEGSLAWGPARLREGAELAVCRV